MSGPNATNADGVDITVTPPASARSHSPCRSAVHAKCSAVSDDEHAVSTVIAGPSRPRTYDTRPASTLDAMPVAVHMVIGLERARTWP